MYDVAKQIRSAKVKQLRKDAKALETVARHLRKEAKDLALEGRTIEARGKMFDLKLKTGEVVDTAPLFEGAE